MSTRAGKGMVELCGYYEQADELEFGEEGGTLAVSWGGEGEIDGEERGEGEG